MNLYGRVTGWQWARHWARSRGEDKLPGLDKYIDLPADSLVAMTRLLLGALAGLLFHPEVTGAAATGLRSDWSRTGLARTWCGKVVDRL